MEELETLTIRDGYRTFYLWERVWQKDQMLEIIQNFLQLVKEEKERKGRKGRENDPEIHLSALSPALFRKKACHACKNSRYGTELPYPAQCRKRKE